MQIPRIAARRARQRDLEHQWHWFRSEQPAQDLTAERQQQQRQAADDDRPVDERITAETAREPRHDDHSNDDADARRRHQVADITRREAHHGRHEVRRQRRNQHENGRGEREICDRLSEDRILFDVDEPFPDVGPDTP